MKGQLPKFLKQVVKDKPEKKIERNLPKFHLMILNEAFIPLNINKPYQIDWIQQHYQKGYKVSEAVLLF